MRKRLKVKDGLKRIIPNLQPELEIVDTVEIEARGIPADTGYSISDVPFEKKTYYYDSNGILYPKRYLDLYYEDVE